MNLNKRTAQVYRLAREEGCNTSADIADALGISIAAASATISDLVEDGRLRRTGKTIRNGNDQGYGPRFRVFEPVDQQHEAAE